MRGSMDGLGAADLDLLLVLLREKSLTGAARALHVEQSTMSRRLEDIERTVGVVLFARSRTGLHASPAALALRPYAEQVEHAVRHARYLTSRAVGRVEGRVRLALPEVVADLMVAPRLHSLVKKHSLLTLELVASSSVADLGRLEADIALRFVRTKGGDVLTTKLLDSDFGVFGHRRFRAVHATRLDQLPWITWSDGDAPEAKWLTARTRTPPILRTNRVTTMIAAARTGLGVVILPRALAAPLQALVEIEVTERPAGTMSVFLASPRAVRNLAPIDAVWRWLGALTRRMVDR